MSMATTWLQTQRGHRFKPNSMKGKLSKMEFLHHMEVMFEDKTFRMLNNDWDWPILTI